MAKKDFTKALVLGTFITIATGLWEYKLKFGFGFLGGVTNRLHGLPLPYASYDLNNKFTIEYFFLIIDLIFWLVISFLILRLFQRFSK